MRSIAADSCTFFSGAEGFQVLPCKNIDFPERGALRFRGEFAPPGPADLDRAAGVLGLVLWRVPIISVSKQTRSGFGGLAEWGPAAFTDMHVADGGGGDLPYNHGETPPFNCTGSARELRRGEAELLLLFCNF